MGTTEEQKKTNEMLPLGTISFPSFLCSLAGVLLSIFLLMMQSFEFLDAKLQSYCLGNKILSSEFISVSNMVQLVVSFGCCISLAAILLDSAYLWRRVVLFSSACVLYLGAGLALMLFGIYYSPFIGAVALIASGSAAILYASQHRMPCEVNDAFIRKEAKEDVTTQPKKKDEVPMPNVVKELKKQEKEAE